MGFSNIKYSYEDTILAETNMFIIITRLPWTMHKHNKNELNQITIHIDWALGELNSAERIE